MSCVNVYVALFLLSFCRSIFRIAFAHGFARVDWVKGILCPFLYPWRVGKHKIYYRTVYKTVVQQKQYKLFNALLRRACTSNLQCAKWGPAFITARRAIARVSFHGICRRQINLRIILVCVLRYIYMTEQIKKCVENVLIALRVYAPINLIDNDKFEHICRLKPGYNTYKYNWKLN